MSIVTTIYDAYHTELASLLPSYARIPNPKRLDDAPRMILNKGFAIIPTTGERSDREVCKFWYKRVYDIVLINQITATVSNETYLDELINSLHEDTHTVLYGIEQSSILNNSSNIFITRAVSDSGVDIVEDGEFERYLQISLQVETEYFV